MPTVQVSPDDAETSLRQFYRFNKLRAIALFIFPRACSLVVILQLVSASVSEPRSFAQPLPPRGNENLQKAS